MSDIRFNQWLHQSGTGGVSQVASGAVGVGTTNPLADFYVRGDAQITGILTAGHIAMGSSITFGDDDRAYFGDGTDLQIYHSGSDSFIQDTGTGDLKIRSSTVRIEDTSGNLIINASPTSAYLYSSGNAKFGTAGWGAQVTGILKVLDASDSNGSTNNLSIGTGNDFKLFHDSSHSRITNTTGNLIIDNSNGVDMYLNSGNDIYIRPQGTENGIKLIGDGAVELYHNSVKKFETSSTGIDVTGKIKATQNIEINADNMEFRVGAGDDLKISHTGSENLFKSDSPTNFKNAANNETIATFTPNGNVVLYHNNTARLITDTTGITVNSRITASGDANTYINVGSSADTLDFFTGGSNFFRFDSSGRMLLNTITEGHNNADDLTIATSGHTGISLRSGASNNGSIFFSDGTSGADEYRGWVQYTHTSDYLTFGTAANERVRITSAGKVGIATDTGNGLINTRHGGTNQQILHVRSDLGSSNGRSLNLYTPDTDNTEAPFRFQTGNGFLFQCDSEDVLTIRHDRKVVIGTNAAGAKLSVGGNIITDDGTNARLTLQAESTSTNQILSTTTGFGSYTALKYQAADHKFQYGGTELVRIHASSKSLQIYGGDLLLGPDSVSQMEATIRAWGCSLWFTTIDPNYFHDSGGEYRQFYNKGSFRGDNYLTATNCPIQTGVGPQNRNFWRGANANTRAEGSLDMSVGYRGAFFFIGQTSCASIPYNGSGRYLFDGNAGGRVSVSFDSFGNNMESGELSFHAGSSAGYDTNNCTIGGKLGSSNSDSTLRMYCIGVNMENYNAPNSKRAGNHLGISVINDDGTDYGSSRLSENLINNSTTGGTNTTTEFNWANRHSNDRGGTTTFRHSQIMYFDNVQLNSAQWDYLEHYFKVMYG